MKNKVMSEYIDSTTGSGPIKGARANEVGNDIVQEDPRLTEFKNKIDEVRHKSIYDSEGHFADALTNGNAQQLDLRYDGPLADFGQSKYDLEDGGVMFNPTAEKIQNQRFDKQWGVTQLGLGLTKGVITAGTTFLDSISMLTFGLGQGIANLADGDDKTGFLDGLWNNELTKAIQSINDWSEDTFKNYYSTEQENSPWYSAKNLLSANFLGDKILKNMGFMVGAFYSGNVLTSPKLLPKFFAGISKGVFNSTSRTAYKVAKSTSAITGSMVSAITEGGIEAVNNSKDWANVQKERLNFQTQEQLADLNRIRPYLTEDMYNAKLQEIQNAHEKTLEQIEVDKVRMGNLDMLLNLPILTAENLFAWGRLYSQGFKNATRFAGKNIKRNAEVGSGITIEDLINGLENGTKRPVLKGIRKGATRSLSEGNEEMAQAWASKYSGLREQQDVDNYYKAALNNEAYERTYENWKAASEAWKNTYGNSDQWEEFAIGAISSVFGMPKIRGYKNETTGKFQSPIIFEGGVRQDIAEAREEKAKAQNVIDYLNDRLKDPKFIKQFEGLTAHTYWQNAMDRAAEVGNKKAYKDAETNQFVSDLINLHQAGLLENAEAILKVAGDVSDITTEEGKANLELIKENDIIKDDNGKPISSQRGWFSVSEDGVVQPLKSDEEIAQQVTERKEKLLKYIDKYKEAIEELDYDSNGVFSDDQLKELAYLRLKKYSAMERMGDMFQKLKDGSDKNIGSIDGFAKTINNSIKELEKKENLTEDESRQLVSLQDLYSVIQQFKNTDFSNFDEDKYAENSSLTSTIVGLINEKNSDGSDASKNAIKSIEDIVKLSKDAAQFGQRYAEYIENPGLVEAQIEQLREEKRKAQIEQRTKEIEDMLVNTSDIHEFKKLYSELIEPMGSFSEDEEYQRNYREVLEALRKSTNPVLKEQFKKLDDYTRLKGDDNNEGSVTQALNKVLQNDDNFRFISKKADPLNNGKSDKDILIDELHILNENLPDYFSVNEFEELANSFIEQLQQAYSANGKNNLTKAIKNIYNKWLDEVKNLEKEYQASLKKDKPKGDTKRKSNLDKFSNTDVYDGAREGEGSDEGSGKGSSDNDDHKPTPPVSGTKHSKYGLTDKEIIAEVKAKMEEFSSKKYELNIALHNIKTDDDKDAALITINNIIKELKDLRDEIYDILTSGSDNDEADDIIEPFDTFIEKKENEKEKILKSINEDEDVSDDLVTVLKNKSKEELKDIADGKETLGLTEKKDIDLLQILAKEMLMELEMPTVQTQSDSDDEEGNNTDDDNEAEGIENIENNKTIFGEGTSNPKNWVYTKYNFNELNKTERRKVLFSKQDSTYKLMDNCGAFDFIDRGNLADLCKDYAKKNKGKQLPIHFILLDKCKTDDHHDVVLGIEVDDEINKLVFDRTGKKLPTNVIKYNEKSYYPLGQVSGYYQNEGSKEAAANIRVKVYEDSDKSKKGFEKGVFVSTLTTEIENFYSGRLFLTDDKKYQENKERSLSELGSAFNANNVILGVYTLAGLKAPRLSANAEIEDPNIHNPVDRSGSVWYMLKAANGIYYPMGVRVGRFDENFWNDESNRKTPIAKKIYELASIICDENASMIARAKAKFELEDYISFPSKNHAIDNPIVFGKDEKTGADIVSINARGQLHNFNNIEERNGKSRVDNFLDDLASCNFRFQVKARLLNNKEYLSTLISSNVLTTNIISDHNVCGSFEIKPLEKDGEIKGKGLLPRQQYTSKKNTDLYGTFNTSKFIYVNGNKNEFVFDSDGKCEGYKENNPKEKNSELKPVGEAKLLLEVAYEISNGNIDNETDHFRTEKDLDVYRVGEDGKGNSIFITKNKNDIKILTNPSSKDYKELNEKYLEFKQPGAQENNEKKTTTDILTSGREKSRPEAIPQKRGSMEEASGVAALIKENKDILMESVGITEGEEDDTKSKQKLEKNIKKTQKSQGKTPKEKTETLDTDAVTDKRSKKELNKKDEECHSGAKTSKRDSNKFNKSAYEDDTI